MSDDPDSVDNRDPLERLAEEFLERLRAGEHPSIDEYAKRHPDMAQSIRELLPAMVKIEQLGATPPAEEGVSAERATAPVTIGPYRILRELCAGGMGVVYLAEDSRLSRRVALKVLTPSLTASAQLLLRFRREAEIASKLDHPSICAVYEAGESDGVAWIAMRYIEGETLAQWIARRRAAESGVTRDDVAAVLRWTEEAARALHEAHEAGLVHRDVKPGNVMIERGTDEQGGRAVVLDFGLARPTESAGDATVTQPGALLGTPAYMSPEQILAERFRLDRRTDVYSLGVALYEALTLRLPFEAATHGQLLQAILTSQPDSPRRLNPTVGSDLRVVVETAMDRERERRYATAADFAEDLRRVRVHEPIRARSAGPLLRLRRWAQRSPVLATSTVGLFLTLVVGLSVALHLLGQVTDERDLKDDALGKLQVETVAKTSALVEAEAERDAKDEALSELRRASRTARSLAVAHASLLARDEDPMLSLLLARECVRAEPGTETVSQLRAALAGSQWRATISVPAKHVTHVAFDPAGHFVAWASSSDMAGVADLASGQVSATMDCGGSVAQLAISPAGDRIATSVLGPLLKPRPGRTHIWSRDGSLVTTIPEMLAATANSAERLVTLTEQGGVALWDWGGRRIAESPEAPGRVTAAAITADAAAVALVRDDASVSVWEVSTGTVWENSRYASSVRLAGIASIPNEAGAYGVCFTAAPSAEWAAGQLPGEGILQSIRVRGGEVHDSTWENADSFPAESRAFLFDAEEREAAAAVFSGGRVVVWRNAGTPSVTPFGSERGSWTPQSFVYSRDGKTAAILGEGRFMLIDPFGDTGTVDVAAESQSCIALSAHGVMAATGSGNRIRLWSCNPGELPSVPTDRAAAVRLSPTEDRLVLGPRGFGFSRRRRLTLASVDGRRIRSLGRQDEWWVPRVTFLPDGRSLLTSTDERVTLWSSDGVPRLHLDAPRGCEFGSLDVSPKGDRFLVVRVSKDAGSRVLVYDLDGHELLSIAPMRPDGEAETTVKVAAMFLADGESVATTTASWERELWSLLHVGRLQGWEEVEFEPGVRADLGPGTIWLSGNDSAVQSWGPTGTRLPDLVPPTCGSEEFVEWTPEAGMRVVPANLKSFSTVRLRRGPVWVSFRGRWARSDWHAYIVEHPSGPIFETFASDADAYPWTCAVTASGDRIFLSTGDGTVRQHLLDMDALLGLADERTSREFTRKELERYARILGDEQQEILAMYDVVDRLFESEVLREDVLARIASDATLSDRARAHAARVATGRADNASFILGKSRIVVTTRNRSADEYARALRWATAAERLASTRSSFVVNLGRAQYRVGGFEAALATLRRADAVQTVNKTADIGRRAFVAMALAGLGRLDEAEREIAAIRAVVEESALAAPAVPQQAPTSPTPTKVRGPKASESDLRSLREAEQVVSAARDAAGNER